MRKLFALILCMIASCMVIDTPAAHQRALHIENDSSASGFKPEAFCKPA